MTVVSIVYYRMQMKANGGLWAFVTNLSHRHAARTGINMKAIQMLILNDHIKSASLLISPNGTRIWPRIFQFMDN